MKITTAHIYIKVITVGGPKSNIELISLLEGSANDSGCRIFKKDFELWPRLCSLSALLLLLWPRQYTKYHKYLKTSF